MVHKNEEDNTMTEENTNLEETTGEETAAIAPKEPKAPRVTVKDPTDSCKEPSPTSKKGKVYAAGRTEEGGSFEALQAEFGCTASNVRQHVAQCHTNLGFGYKIEGDTFWITGDVTESWEDQAAAKALISEKKKAVAKEKADAKKAEAKANAPEGEATDSSAAEEVPETPAEDDGFLE